MTNELTDLALREAVARALGWRQLMPIEKFGSWVHDCTIDTAHIYYGLTRPVDSQARFDYSGDGLFHSLYPPAFESSLDACFAPGGPVERLRERYWSLTLTNGEDSWGAEFEAMDELADGLYQATKALGESSETPAEAVCRAFLKAVEERHD